MIKRVVRVVLTLAVIVAGAAGAYELWDYYMLSPWTRDSRVVADVVTIAPDVAGFVTDLRVKDNQAVKKGDFLFVLDQDRYKLALAMADANVAARQADMESKRRTAERRAQLTNLSTSTEERENTRFAADASVAAYAQAVTDRATARLNLDRTVVRAPVNGFVTNLTLVIGQYASVGTKLLALIDSDSYRVQGYFEETKLKRVALGQRAEILLMDGSPPLSGHVASIARGITDPDNGTGPDLLARTNPTFEWVRLAQRIPVRVQIDEGPSGVFVSSGMTCTVVLETGPREWATKALIADAVAAARRIIPGLLPDAEARSKERGS
jgi:multidrug resistance efflux pump